MRTPALLLLPPGAVLLTEPWAGPHTLRYSTTSVSAPGREEPWYSTVGYVDDDTEIARVVIDALSLRRKLAERWEKPLLELQAWRWTINTFGATTHGKSSNMNGEQSEPEQPARPLQPERTRFNHPGSGLHGSNPGHKDSRGEALTGASLGAGSVSHAFQEMTGCVVGSDGRFLRGFSQFAYDGTDYLALNQDLRSWTTADPPDKETRNSPRHRLVHLPAAERQSINLKDTCVHQLRLFLEKGKETLLRFSFPQ